MFLWFFDKRTDQARETPRLSAAGEQPVKITPQPDQEPGREPDPRPRLTGSFSARPVATAKTAASATRM